MSLHFVLKELAELLQNENKRDARRGGKLVSNTTQELRKQVLVASFKQLYRDGYRLLSVKSFREKHAKHLIRHWEAKGLSASAIQMRTSILRFFVRWIGKEGMIGKADIYLLDPQRGVRTYVAQEDHSWTAKDINPDDAIALIERDDAITAMQLRLCLTFGLRRKEAIMLKPHIADKGFYLAVSEGTKGGRDRTVPIDTERKRQVLDQAKAMARRPNGTVSNRNKTLRAELAHFSYILNSRGYNRKELQVTAHGLRHQYLNDRYKEIAGHPSPVRGGVVADKERDLLARMVTTEEAGHSRPSITTAYYGSARVPGKAQQADTSSEASPPVTHIKPRDGR